MAVTKDYTAKDNRVIIITNETKPEDSITRFASVKDGGAEVLFEDIAENGGNVKEREDTKVVPGTVSIQLFRINKWVTLGPKDSVKITVRSTAEAAYYASLATENIKVETEAAPALQAGEPELVADESQSDEGTEDPVVPNEENVEPTPTETPEGVTEEPSAE